MSTIDSTAGNKTEEDLIQFLDDFPKKFQSLILSTVDRQGSPNPSYAPYVQDATGNFFVFLSGLARHSRNLATSGRAGVLFIDDEKDTEQIFARRRLTFFCHGREVQRDSDQWKEVRASFVERFGDIAKFISSMPDFRMFRLEVRDALIVLGFGSAYRGMREQTGQWTMQAVRGEGENPHGEPLPD